jgi:2-aminoethylphosphonate dioxygenase
MVLSSDQRRDFERDGLVVVRGVFSPTEIAAYAGAIEQLADRPAEPRGPMVFFENRRTAPGTAILSRIEAFVGHDAVLTRVVIDPRIGEPVSALLAGRAVLFKDKINFKRPGGGGFAPHQDIQAGWDAYASYFVSALVAIDENTIANGCLELAAGHHRRGMIGRRGESLEGDALAGLQFLAYPMDAGDVVFFDCFTPHRSQPNFTNRPRRNLYLTYNRAADGNFRDQYYADKRKNARSGSERTAAGTRPPRV